MTKKNSYQTRSAYLHLVRISRSKSSKLEQEVALSVSSRLGVAQVFLSRGHLFSGHTVGEQSSSFLLRERGNDHNFVARLKETQEQRSVFSIVLIKAFAVVIIMQRCHMAPLLCGFWSFSAMFEWKMRPHRHSNSFYGRNTLFC